MPQSRSIPQMSEARKANEILHFPDALEHYPDALLFVYNRVSSYSNAGKDKVKLDEKTYAVSDQVCRMAPGRVRMIASGVEEGKLSKRRPTLIRAVESATRWSARRHQPVILVASFLSRWIRSEDYHRLDNPEAPLTDADIARLHEVTNGFILTTLAPPTLTESEMQSYATNLTGKAGRPTKMTPDMQNQVFESLAYCLPDDLGRTHYGRSLRRVAADFGISPATIIGCMDRPSPLPELTWRNWLLKNAEEEELISILPDGSIVMKVDWPLPKRSPRYDRPGRPPKWKTR